MIQSSPGGSNRSHKSESEFLPHSPNLPLSMEQSGGEVAAKRAKASDDAGAGGEDRLSALPDDVLVLVLLRVPTEDAGRTSVLSRRWRHVWTLLPEFGFEAARDPRILLDALSGSDVPLHHLVVGAPDASAHTLAAWLPAAARRVVGEMFLVNMVERRTARARGGGGDQEEEASQGDTFELPCFEKAAEIYLDLGFLGLSLPPAGVFARLTELTLRDTRFHSPGDLGDVVSSPRCPCLQNLTVHNVRGLDTFTINSKSLQLLDLNNLRRVRQVTVVAPSLKKLTLLHCFIHDGNQPVVNISAPQIKSLSWSDAYDPSSVQLGSMKHLQTIGTFYFVYGPDGFKHNYACRMLLPQFKAIEYLKLSLGYFPEVANLQYLMEDMKLLPQVTTLQLNVVPKGHSFGSCSFHVLRICSGIKRLVLILTSLLEKQTVCSSGCICHQPTNWKTEKLTLNCLQELEIEGLKASEHHVAFVKCLLNWVTVLRTMTVTFDRSVTESKAKELFQMFLRLSRPGIRVKFYIYRKSHKAVFAPED